MVPPAKNHQIITQVSQRCFKVVSMLSQSFILFCIGNREAPGTLWNRPSRFKAQWPYHTRPQDTFLSANIYNIFILIHDLEIEKWYSFTNLTYTHLMGIHLAQFWCFLCSHNKTNNLGKGGWHGKDNESKGTKCDNLIVVVRVIMFECIWHRLKVWSEFLLSHLLLDLSHNLQFWFWSFVMPQVSAGCEDDDYELDYKWSLIEHDDHAGYDFNIL